MCGRPGPVAVSRILQRQPMRRTFTEDGRHPANGALSYEPGGCWWEAIGQRAPRARGGKLQVCHNCHLGPQRGGWAEWPTERPGLPVPVGARANARSCPKPFGREFVGAKVPSHQRRLPLVSAAQQLHPGCSTPMDAEHWLQHWGDGGGGSDAPGNRRTMNNASIANQPVRYVSTNEAQQYCQHYKLRLPHSWEWQWFAGRIGRRRSAVPLGRCGPGEHDLPKHLGGGWVRT